MVVVDQTVARQELQGQVLGRQTQFAVNHVAGLHSLLFKPDLAKFTAGLAASSPRLFNGSTPEAYVLPGQLHALRERLRREGLTDTAGMPHWLVKRVSHRGIHALQNGSHKALQNLGLAIVQRRVTPLLLQSAPQIFDIGLYVMISSVRPLRVYLFEEQLVRFCKEAYPRTQAGFSSPDSFVVNDYLPVWTISAFAGDVVSCKGSPSCILRRQLRAEGYNDVRLWRTLETIVASLLVAVRPSIEAGLPRTHVPHQSTFELLRFDFLVNKSAMPVLTEVNMSPNLVSKTAQDGVVKRKLLRAILSVAAKRLDRKLPMSGRSFTCRTLPTGQRCCSLARGCPRAGITSDECLSNADVRLLALAEAEDSEAIAMGMVRVFPPRNAALLEEMLSLWPRISHEDALHACGAYFRHESSSTGTLWHTPRRTRYLSKRQ